MDTFILKLDNIRYNVLEVPFTDDTKINMTLLQTSTSSQLPKWAESLFSFGFFVLLLVALYFAFKIFNKNHK
jgi:hypothetical protein